MHFARVASLVVALSLPHATSAGAAEIEFASEDGLSITADVYRVHESPETPFIVLFHQAGSSRGEYLEIAPRLNALGFNCMAVDQRSGEAMNGVANETARRAGEAGLPTRYVDALPDLVASLRFARERYAKGTLLAWGSSYSASLVLLLAGDRPELMDAALAFAPGEYFQRQGRPARWIRDAASRIEKPVFVTSARAEGGRWAAIFEVIPSPEKTSFLPESEGNHGSRALWSRFPDSADYWRAVEGFLHRYRDPSSPD